MMTQVFTGPPTITTHPTSQLIPVSMNVTLNCEGTGRKPITYQWETNNINGGQWMSISNTNSTTFVVGTLEQSQQYRCVVSNEAGSTISNVATVTVLSKLYIFSNGITFTSDTLIEITTQPVSVITIALQNSSLNCSASVDDAAYSWHRVNGTIPSRSIGQNSDILIIPRATPHDIGEYYCTVKKENISVESNEATVTVNGEK